MREGRRNRTSSKWFTFLRSLKGLRSLAGQYFLAFISMHKNNKSKEINNEQHFNKIKS